MKTIIIEPGDLDRVIGAKTLFFEMLRLRAKVFRDILGWKVKVDHLGLEFDEFDVDAAESARTVYVVVVEDKHVIGSLRLLPTTERTMMVEVFGDCLAGKPPCDPVTWECSRVCYYPSSKLRQLQVSLKLIEGIREVSARHGIATLVGNFDDKMCSLYTHAGFAFEKLGQTSMFGPAVYLGRFNISPEILTKVEETLGQYIEKLQSYQGAA